MIAQGWVAVEAILNQLRVRDEEVVALREAVSLITARIKELEEVVNEAGICPDCLTYRDGAGACACEPA